MNSKIPDFFVRQFVFFLICFPFLCFCLLTDTISPGLVIRDPDTIVSRGHVYKLGFFSPDSATGHRYLGVFYNVSEETVVWVANRDAPLTDSSGAVTVSRDGNLVVLNGRNQTVWSTNSTTSSSPMNTTLQIQDTGNLVLRDGMMNIIWDSFSHPADVFLPDMKISHNIRTGKKVMLSSWKNATDPGVGSFTAGVEAFPITQTIIWNNGRPHWRSGQWNGLIFVGMQDMYSPYSDGLTGVTNDSVDTVYFYMKPVQDFLYKFHLNSSGSLVETMWNVQQKTWDPIYMAPKNVCDVYGTCGPFGNCNTLGSPICSCLKGFEPVNGEEWGRGNWTSGCRRTNQLQCDGGRTSDGFEMLPFMKVPDFAERFDSNQVDECRRRCLGNCSCLAYAHDSYLGCMFWSDTLIDVQRFDGVGVNFYVRLSASEFDKKDKKLYIIIPVVVGFVCISILFFIGWCFMAKRKAKRPTLTVPKDDLEKVNVGELPLFTFEMLANATDRFHEGSLLGRGGFGPVYKGILGNGKEIAVKRLSAASGQGMQEFMNEVIVISKLQHRNLVKLLGCCVEKEEKMLVYEYMPNKSLDVCLFDTTHPPQEEVLDWTKRFNIIEGIGRGLLYLHRDSRLRIIHRDLKPSNVLLDEDWNPKISDFGMARIFGGTQDHSDTARVVGTYGYMAPEYAMEGRFSEKSDVYSFGVLMLEIVKGKKNTNYYSHELSLSLLGCAWKSWSEGKGLAFADERIASSELTEEIVRCIQIGLLCVQELPNQRPTIQTVLSMLSHEIVELPLPEQPACDENWEGLTTRSTLPGNQVGYSGSEFSLTVVDGR